MDEPEKITVLRESLELHSAYVAWKQVDSRARVPTSIEILKPEKRKSAVYRLLGVTSSGRPVIAKRQHEGYLQLEHRLYTEVLSDLPLCTLEVYGFFKSHDGYSWLFLEDAGDEWYSPKIPEHQLLAAEWLATLHTTATSDLSWLPQTGTTFQLDVLRNAQREVRESLGHRALTPVNIETLNSILRWLDKAEERWPELESACADVPESLVHGDFVPKNVRVRKRSDRLELVAFDWEHSGWATPATDLALLPDSGASLEAYHTRTREAGWRLRWSDIVQLRNLGDLFRLINCVHWETRSFRYDWIESATSRMEVYEERLKVAIDHDFGARMAERRLAQGCLDSTGSTVSPAPDPGLRTRSGPSRPPGRSARQETAVARDALGPDPAFHAWRQVRHRAQRPTSIQILQFQKRESAVYRLNGVGPSGSAVIAKGKPNDQLESEPRLYAEVLRDLPVATLDFYGFVEEQEGYSWLFLEDAGDEMYSPKVLEHRALAADWLAALHTSEMSDRPWLPRRKFEPTILETAQRDVQEMLGHRALVPRNVETLELVLRWLHKTEERWGELELTEVDVTESLVHGDFLPKNIRTRKRRGQLELVGLDWDSAGWAATPMYDLGFLPNDRASLRRYHARVREAGSSLSRPELEYLKALSDLYWTVTFVHWEALSFRYAWITDAMRRMEVYEQWLRTAIAQDVTSSDHSQ